MVKRIHVFQSHDGLTYTCVSISRWSKRIHVYKSHDGLTYICVSISEWLRVYVYTCFNFMMV